MRPRAVALALVAAACAVGPRYRRPDTGLPADYRGALAPAQAASLANRPWWELFQDPDLSRLVETALRQNLDVAIAAARVDEARAAVTLGRAPLLPQVDAGATATFQHHAPGAAPGPSSELAARASWELDLWGKYRRATEAARAELLATEMGRRAAVTTVIADVARSWIQLAALSAQFQITREAIASAEQSLALVRRLAEGGVSSEAEVRQAEVQLVTFQVQIPSLERQRAQLEDALSVLLGEPPRAVATPNGARELIPGPDIPAGLPSELLERRPDVAAAEQQLVAANANVGVAKAAFFPSVSLTGVLGVVSGPLGALVSHGQDFATGSGILGLPIFAGGRNVANYEIARSRAEQAALAYRAAVLGALADVSDALVEQSKRSEEVVGQRRRVAASEDVLRLTNRRFQAGVVSYLEVLDAMRSLYSARTDLANAYAAREIGVVRLYQALGGGWSPEGGEGEGGVRAAR